MKIYNTYIMGELKLAIDKAAQILKDNFIHEPPVRVTEIAENYGLEVKKVKIGPNLADSKDGIIAGFINPNAMTIFVNVDDSPVRQAFTIAHELGHWFLHRDQLNSEPDKYAILYRKPLGAPNDDIIEKQANTFAASLLVPKQMLKKYEQVADYSFIANIFGVSNEVIGYRLNNEFGKPRKR